MIVSEEKEFKIGQQLDDQVHEAMGIYLELPRLRATIKEMGERIGANSDRPNLIYRVEIVNQPTFNAFAVPGGFIYVHRGLLERMNSMDELASVLGHEIAHVAARHSAAQISKAQMMNLGLIGLVIATQGKMGDYGQLLNIGAALAMNKFSRDDEREADHFGVKYTTLAGYNPKGAIDSMLQIQRLETGEPNTVEIWFQTHPPTVERLDNLTQEINVLRDEQPEVLNRPIKRNEFIALLDGLAIGEWNGMELISGNRYYNKEFLLSIAIPREWSVQINNQNYTAIFFDPHKEFFAFFDVEPLRQRKSSAEYFNDYEQRMGKLGLRRENELKSGLFLKHGAMSAVYSGYDNRTGAILAEIIAFTKGVNGYCLRGFSKNPDFKAFQPVLESMINSLQFISQEEASKLSPPRMRIHEVQTGETWNSISRSYFGSPSEANKLAEYNGFDVNEETSTGILLKIPPSLRFR
jgi:predicted Zn-dependent protease